MQAGRYRTAVVLSVYLLFFAIAIHFFVTGRHESAWMLLFGSFLVLVGYVIRTNRP
jgi:hypothetical protein